MSARHDRARPAVKARGDDSGQTRGGRSCALCIIVVVFVFLWHPSPYTLAPPAAAAAAGAPVTFADLFEGDDVDVAGAAQARWIAHAAAETDAPTPRGRARKTHAAPRASAAARPPRPCAPRGLALDDGEC
ncbi:hypothetical protein M885DRAFT_577655 [Pelagophyceae sp. CCMP2097]|nr:hypothetical protein M885DRAFT_577655 [Pelagophyceae sp. CCMP2097]